MGRRQACLGTPIPRMPRVAPGPKVRSGLASRRSQGSSTEHRGTPKPAASVDAWRLIGRGRLRFPTLPRQLPDLTNPCDMQGKPSLPAIVGGAGWPSFAINGEGAEPPSPISSLLVCFFLLAPPPVAMAPSKRFSAAEKGKAPREGPGSPAPKRGRGCPRKHAATPAVAHRRGGTAVRGGDHPIHGGSADEGRRAMVARPPRPRFHSAEVSPEFVVWSESPAGSWL